MAPFDDPVRDRIGELCCGVSSESRGVDRPAPADIAGVDRLGRRSELRARRRTDAVSADEQVTFVDEAAFEPHADAVGVLVERGQRTAVVVALAP